MTDPKLLDLALSKFMLASVLLGEDMKHGLEARRLTRVRATALWEIAEGGAVKQRELADRLGVTPRNVTALVDALESSGFVKRASHRTDRRATMLLLTDEGKAATDRMRREKAAMAVELLGSVTKLKLKAFIEILDGIVERLALDGKSQGDSPGKSERQPDP